MNVSRDVRSAHAPIGQSIIRLAAGGRPFMLLSSLLIAGRAGADKGSVILAEAQNDTFLSFLTIKIAPSSRLPDSSL